MSRHLPHRKCEERDGEDRLRDRTVLHHSHYPPEQRLGDEIKDLNTWFSARTDFAYHFHDRSNKPESPRLGGGEIRNGGRPFRRKVRIGSDLVTSHDTRSLYVLPRHFNNGCPEGPSAVLSSGRLSQGPTDGLAHRLTSAVGTIRGNTHQTAVTPVGGEDESICRSSRAWIDGRNPRRARRSRMRWARRSARRGRWLMMSLDSIAMSGARGHRHGAGGYRRGSSRSRGGGAILDGWTSGGGRDDPRRVTARPVCRVARLHAQSGRIRSPPHPCFNTRMASAADVPPLRLPHGPCNLPT
jgi:hypothetical protein